MDKGTELAEYIGDSKESAMQLGMNERFSWRREADFADKLLSAMRYEFGGHLEQPAP